MMWTDESSFELCKNSRQVKVWRRAYEKYDWDCIAPTFKSGRSSVMVWGAMTSATKCPLVLMPAGERTADDFVRNVYDEVLGSFWLYHQNADDYVLMEDGAPIHRSNCPKDWLEQIGLSKLIWPANSPDLNPIENAWFICKPHVQARARPTTKDTMFSVIKDV